MVLITTVVAVVLMLLTVVTLYDAVHVVEEGRIEAVLVFGEMRAVIEPGLNVIPPFVSTTCPVDPESMTMETSHGRSEVPAEFRSEVREAANG